MTLPLSKLTLSYYYAIIVDTDLASIFTYTYYRWITT